MKSSRLLALSTLLVLPLAHAAGPDPDTIDFPKNMEFAAEVTLLTAAGNKSASRPLESGHRVQLRFDEKADSKSKTIPCTLNIAKKVGQITPGEAAVVGIKCDEVVKVPRSKLGFALMDGDRRIGSGAVRP